MFKNLVSCILAITMLLSLSVRASATTSSTAEVTTEIVSVSSQNNERKINITKTISLSVGDTWKKRFDTDRLLFEDHNAFKVELANVSGSFKVIIMGGNGFYFESSTYTDTNVTFVTANASADVQYTVSVINTSNDTNLSATVEIESFYNG